MTAAEGLVWTPAEWTCRGRRFLRSDRKLYTVWADAAGAERWYLKQAGTIGGRYAVEVADTGNGSLYMRLGDYLGQVEDRAEAGAWAALDRAAQAAQGRARLEASAKRTTELDEALAPLLAVAGRLNAYGDREALARYVAAKIHGAP